MKQKLKVILILTFAILLFVTASFVFKACTVDKQKIIVKYNTNISTATNLETIVSVVDKNGNTKKSNLVLELFDNDNKKVKGVKEKYKLDEGEVANCSLAIPADLAAGNYNLKLTARSGLLSTKKEVSIAISNANSSDIVISLDKGIYKPSDTIKYRALLVSRADCSPQNSKDTLVEIFDGNGNKVYSQNSKTTEFGIISGEFTLAKEVNSGTYLISVDTNSKKVTKTFVVNPYVAPQFKVNIETEKDVYQVGEKANITFNTKYFFGEPVVNAEVVGKVGDVEIKGLTDNDGKYVYTYNVQRKGKIDIAVSVTDISNYFVEANKTLYAQEYAFEVETIFENGQINKNMNNDIYILAKKVDGTPVKVKATITVGKVVRQVITDENGIGKFTLTANDTSSLENTVICKISASDNENNSYTNVENIEVVKSSVVISTNKIKYRQGEDIEISLNSILDSGRRTIYICKNGEIVKMVSTDSDRVTLNLDNISGLIDIFVEGKLGNNYRYDDDYLYFNTYSPVSKNNNSNYVRKTIFIKPEKSLSINVSTDKAEYKPGENLNIAFSVQDENKEKVDTNLLVSILDEAVLSIADNDLAMDNIRLALKDIDLTDEISAADIYADILDDSSESSLMLALLKHNADNPNIREDSFQEKNSYEYIPVITGLVLAIVLVVLLYITLTNSKKIKNILKDIINILIIEIIVFTLFENSLYYIFTNNFIIKTLITSSLLVLIIYCLALYNKRDKIFELIEKLLVIPGIYIVIMSIIYNLTDYNENFALFGNLLVPVIMTVLIVWGRNHKLNKFFNFIKELTIILVKAGISYYIALIITEITFDSYNCFITFVILVYLIINRIYKTKVLNEDPPTKQLNISQILLIGLFILILICGSNNPMIDDIYYSDIDHIESANRNNEYDFDTFGIDSISSATNSATTGFGMLENIFENSSKSVRNTIDKIKEPAEIEYEADVQEENIVEETSENIRNIFLESLAFIPNLIAENGVANTQLKLSDNITTWNIQVVGNTKNGNIGSSGTTFRVFKEFFVDFSLPTNSVVTDKTSIPVTIYNYKDTSLTVNLNVIQNDWSNIGNYTQSHTIEAGNTKLVYIPLEIMKAGNNTLRVEARSEGISDIVERSFTVNPNGYKKTNVISSSTIDKSFETDYFSTEEAIENTRKLKLKIYPSAISQAIDGMESIFRMPTGCFEQTSSSLYPNILALKYLQDNNLDSEEIREKALEYISTGYQRLLTFEVPGEKGGYSLFGYAPAEPVITAFGLMELNDATTVYDVDEQVIENMKEYLYRVQKINGSFDINSHLETGAASQTDLAMNAYIIWALSEVNPDDSRIEASIKYLEDNLDNVEDNYTLALIANAFTNVKNRKTNIIINKLMENVIENSDNAYVSSNIRDYYGTYGDYQAVQTTALASMALSKNNLHTSTNNSFIKYLISHKDSFGNWGTTQATILSLKAINMASNKGKISGQTITASVNGVVKEIKVSNNPLDIYELEFSNIKDENKISIDIKKGNLTYELIEEYYVPYKTIEENKEKFSIGINSSLNSNIKVNDTIIQSIEVTNNLEESITNGLISLSIPQGCSVIETYLERAKALGIIEKFEYNYSNLNIYIRNFKAGERKSIDIYYRANYPEEITGGAVRAYDYYNPSIEGIKAPVNIIVGE